MSTVTRRMQLVVDDGEASVSATGLRVAFASTDMKTVNQHFGAAKSFAIYNVDLESVEFVEAVQFGELEQDGNEDKLAVKFDLLKGCSAVYCQAAGASAIRQLMANGIQPVKVAEGSEIELLLEDLQTEMRAGPSAWLAKAIRQHSGAEIGRFNSMADEEWSE